MTLTPTSRQKYLCKMQKLNLPDYDFKFKKQQGKTYIFDDFRKKYVVITPEEWVRQNLINFLVEKKNYPKSLIVVEKGLKINDLVKRADVLVYKNSQPILLVECKSPSVKISQETFDQISRYNLAFKVPYLLVSNGLNHYCCKIDFTNQSFRFLSDIPAFTEL